ncbi:hypothetical protein MMC07_001747 [Pseudocyphellaria aurata]|nr:hypothetical protein [Pseudocyphellaria aurata]
MRLLLATTLLLFITEQANLVQGLSYLSPKPIIDISHAYRQQGYVEEKIRRDARIILNHALNHQRDIIPSPTEADVAVDVVSPPSKSAESDQSSTWDKDTEAACREALSKTKNSPSNPSGMVACYNIRSFNNTTGTFQSDLRLYRTSAPTGDWASLNSRSMSIKLSCSGASISMRQSSHRKRDEMLSWPPVRRATRQAVTLRRSTPASPQMLQDLTFDGKVHDEMGNIKNIAVNSTSARSLLMPTITLSGTTTNDKTVNTQVSSGDASFINGAFAHDQTKASSSSSGPSPSGTLTPTGPFVLPGKTLAIFPVGFVITGVWALLFVAVVGAGTVDRIRFREAYRRRVKREKTVGLRMI